MLKSKLKKLACITLAVSMVFSNVSMSVKAKVVDGSDYSAGDKNEKAGFANAVSDFYGTDKNEYGLYDQYQVNGDFEIACFTDNYEYSIVKDGDARQKYEKGDTVNGTQAKASCIWEDKTVNMGGGNTYNLLGVDQITYLGEYSGKAETSPESGTSIEWVYDLVRVQLVIPTSDRDATYTTYYAVNMTPKNKNVNIETLTLPAYIKANVKDNNGKALSYVKCIELGDAAFLLNANIKHVNIPDTYQRICAYAFTGCKNLVSVKFVNTQQKDNNNIDIIDCYEILETDENSSKTVLENSDLHFVGAGAFAGCYNMHEQVKFPTSLTEGYRYIDDESKDQGYAAVKKETVITDGKRVIERTCRTSGQVLNEDIVSVTSQEYSENIKKKNQDSGNILRPYFMGQGVFRDCYSINTVTIDGVNPFIPANTYAGCSGINKIQIGLNVKNIYFGPACFAGADGSGLASSLEQLVLGYSTPVSIDKETTIEHYPYGANLESITIGAYAFKNCKSLVNVEINADLNTQDEIYSKVQGTELYPQREFQYSFTKNSESCFNYNPKTTSEFVISEGFFQSSKVQSLNFGGKLKYNENTSEKCVSKIIVEDYAFTNTDCESLKLYADKIVLNTGSLYSVGSNVTKEVNITIKSKELDYHGEPFANTKHSNDTYSSDNGIINKIIIDSNKVNFSSEQMTEEVPNNNNYEEKLVYINPCFYGLSSNTKLYFTSNVQTLSGGLAATKNANYYYYNEKKKQKDFNIKELTANTITHNTFGDLYTETAKSGIYFLGYNLKGNLEQSSNFFIDDAADKETAKALFYADGNVNLYLKNKLCTKEDEKINTYTQQIVKSEIIELIKSINNIVSLDYALKNLKLMAYYADGTNEIISYSEKDKSDSVNGFIMTENNSELEEDKHIILEYRGQKCKVGTTFVRKVPTTITASAVKGTEFVAGTEPKLSDFEIDHVLYNDETKDANIKFGEINENSDLSLGQFDVSVVTESGINTYQLGKNTVKITYTDSENNVECSSTCIVTAEAPKVATMSAVLSGTKKAYYEGDILTAKDFNITAEYNDEKTIDAYYAKSTDKYTINPEILPTMNPTDDSVVTTVTLIDENGASTTVDINVNKVKPLYLEISYLPDDVEIGNELKKEDFEVVLHYNNNKTKTLEPDEFEIRYGTLKVDHQNNVHVIYTYNGQSITETVMVKVVEAPVEVTEAPATEAPVEVTEAPVEVTEAPAETTETPATEVPNTITDTETTAAPTATEGTTPATTESPATVVPTATEAPTATASTTPATAVPTATASVTPAPAATTIVQGPNPSSMTGQLDGSVTKATIGVGEKIAILNLASVTYTSSDSNILAVNNNIVTGKKVGKATVTIADANGNTKIYSITVKKAPKKIKASSKKVLKKGKTAKIKVLFQKGCYSYTNTFKSSNKKVATVDKTGVVTAKAKGSCKITVKTYNNKKATVKITVK